MSFQLQNWQRDPTKQGNTLLNTDVYAYGSLCWTTKTSYIYHNSSWIIQVDVFTNSSGACAAFISNMDYNNDKRVVFRYVSYHLPAWSVSILADCKTVVFNIAKSCRQSAQEVEQSRSRKVNGSFKCLRN